jgi:hypothetical protein
MGEWKIRTAKNKKSGGDKLAGLADKAYKAGFKLGAYPRAVIGATKAFTGGVMGLERAGPNDVMGKNKKSPAAPKKKGTHTPQIQIQPKKKKKTNADYYKSIPR